MLAPSSPTPKLPQVSVRTAYLLLLLTMVIWASAFAGIRYVLSEIDPMSMTALRLFVASVVLIVLAVVFRVRLPRRQDWPVLILAALSGFTIYHYLLNLGTATISAGQASFVIATIPIWTAVLAWRFLGERLSLRNWAGLLLGLCGVGVMSLDFSSLSVGVGTWIVLGSAVSAGVNMVISKDLLNRYRPLDIAVYAAVLGALPYLLHLPWTLEAAADLSPPGWLVLIYLGAVPIGVGYWLSSIALATLPANQVAQMLLLVPPMAAVIAWATIGEVPSVMLFVGGPMILVGVLLGRRRVPRPNSRTSDGV